MDFGSVIGRHRRPIVLGCAGAVVMSLVSCILLGALAVGPAFSASVPPPPEADPTRPDIAMVMREQFMNRALIEALPEEVPVEGTIDVQPGNRLVFRGEITLFVAKVPVVMTLGLGLEQGQLRLALESMEAAGYDIMELTGLDAGVFMERMGEPLQDQIEAGLGPGSEILSVSTDEEQLVITGRWAE